MTIASKIARYIKDIQYDDIPRDVLEYSRFALADFYAVTYQGAKTKDAAIIKSYVKTCRCPGICSVIGCPDHYSAQHAALINGTMGHALDYDDVGLTAINHPSVTNAPVMLALGEELGRSGREALTSFTLGVEIQHKIAGALMPELTNRGWHTTSVFGTLGAAVTAALLYHLSSEEIINAIGIAATLSSGIRGNFGTYTKPFHAGMAAQNGILAAQLALEGMTASPVAIEGEDGFAQVFAGRKVTEDDIKLGEPWDAQYSGFQFKKYPVCSSSHTALDAFLALKEELGFTYADIEAVTAGMSEFAFRNLVFNAPQTVQQAKFSMPYAVSCACVYGNLTLEHFTQETLEDVRVRMVMPKVKMVLDDAFKDAGIIGNEPAIVYVSLKDGRTASKRVDYALGTVKNPLSKEELEKKFYDCLTGVRREKADEIFSSIFELEKFGNLCNFICRW